MVRTISLFVSGFIMKALMPAAFADSASTRWLKPVQRMMGMPGRRAEDLSRKLDPCEPRHGLVGDDGAKREGSSCTSKRGRWGHLGRAGAAGDDTEEFDRCFDSGYGINA